MATTFWYVYNPQRNKPRYRHDTEESAVREARRLARLHPNETFIVLRAVCVVTSEVRERIDYLVNPEEPSEGFFI